MTIDTASQLSDTALVMEVKRLAGEERTCTARLIAHLVELDRRRLYLGAGFSSLFTYSVKVLRLSEGAAYHRITAARTAMRFPRILDMLAEGALNLTSVQLLAPHLTDENAEQLFAEASHKGKREVEELVARHAPRPDVPSSIRKVPVLAAAKAPEIPQVSSPASPGGPSGTIREAPPTAIPLAPSTPTRRPVVQPLAPARYEVRFTASFSTCEKLRLAQDLLRHAIPSGDTAEIVDRALTALLEELARKKYGAAKRPRANPGTLAPSRYIPAWVKRAVWLRDRGRCRFIGKEGRCQERGFLEFHHLLPYGAGGEATVENIELRCRAHNGHEAELYYGPGIRTGEYGRVREREYGYVTSSVSGLAPERAPTPAPSITHGMGSVVGRDRGMNRAPTATGMTRARD